MSFWAALFLGLVQGVTEFLPVSSSGHLALFGHFFSLRYDESAHLLFEVLLHFATLIAVCVFYWRDVKAMVLEVPRAVKDLAAGKGARGAGRGRRGTPAPRKLLFMLIVGTLPLAVFVFFSDAVEELARQPMAVGVALCCTGVLLWLSSRLPRGKKDESNANMKDALTVGLMQGIAIIPGLSRSGMTISTGVFRGFDRKFAVRFSFLLSIPTILGATALQVYKAIGSGADWSLMPVYLGGMLVAGIAGYLSLCLLRRIAERGFANFAYYCVIIGATAIVLNYFNITIM